MSKQAKSVTITVPASVVGRVRYALEQDLNKLIIRIEKQKEYLAKLNEQRAMLSAQIADLDAMRLDADSGIPVIDKNWNLLGKHSAYADQ